MTERPIQQLEPCTCETTGAFYCPEHGPEPEQQLPPCPSLGPGRDRCDHAAHHIGLHQHEAATYTVEWDDEGRYSSHGALAKRGCARTPQCIQHGTETPPTCDPTMPGCEHGLAPSAPCCELYDEMAAAIVSMSGLEGNHLPHQTVDEAWNVIHDLARRLERGLSEQGIDHG